jgi:hypothetical protein
MIVDPELAVHKERDRCLTSSKILSVSGYQYELAIEQVAIDVVHNPGRAVVGIGPCISFGFFDGNPTRIMILYEFPQRDLWPPSHP